MTLVEVANLSGLSTAQISRIENGDRNWSVDSITKIAGALGVEVLELLDTSQAWQDAAVVGAVGQAVWFRRKINGKSLEAKVKLPAAIGDVVAVLVEGSALYPRYTEGDIVAVSSEPQEPSECLNRECLVGVDSGYFAFKTVQIGAEPGHYNLISHNEPPILNRKLESCRPVLFVARS